MGPCFEAIFFSGGRECHDRLGAQDPAGRRLFQGPYRRSGRSAFLKGIATHQKLVQDSVKVPLSQQQFDALASLSYNLPKAFNAQRSELLRDLNQQDYSGAADQFLRWTRAGGAVMPGLTKRRNYERKMFLDSVYTEHK